MCSEDAFMITLIPLLAKTFKLNVGKLSVRPNKPEPEALAEFYCRISPRLRLNGCSSLCRNNREAKASSSAAPCDYPQTLIFAAADDDSSEQTGGLRRERIAAGAG